MFQVGKFGFSSQENVKAIKLNLTSITINKLCKDK